MKNALIALLLVPALLFSSTANAGQRINQEGRILGLAPVVRQSTLFNTPEADAIVSAMQIFPVTNAWNEDISRRPLLPNSAAMIAQISADLLSSRQTLRPFMEMNFVLVPDSQPLVPIDFVDYPDESDPSPYPIPSNMPIETWPAGISGQTLLQWQQDALNLGGDRHAIIVQPGAGFVREMWQAKLVGTNWQASNGAKFDLNSNTLRPAGWTSGDAAGLSMFPALVRFDECERGVVEHAVRLVVKRTRREYIYPATHYASTTSATMTNVPAMGQRLRLKSSFAIPSNWTKQERAVLLGLKKYGAIVADNGNFFSISVTPDDRWPSGAFDHLSSVNLTNFEVIQTTGPSEGPRSPNPPRASAGGDRSASFGAPFTLPGNVAYSGNAPVITWKQYSGPGVATFSNASLTNATVTFSAPGVYTLMLSADDGVHAVSYDAAVITVAQNTRLAVTRAGTNATVTWSGAAGTCVVESTSSLSVPAWTPVLTTSVRQVSVPMARSNQFFRVRAP